MSNKKILPKGITDFKEFQDNGYYYVDKTLFIKELSPGNAIQGVNLFLRPRRFGKSLMQSTLSYFFDIDLKEEAKGLFDGLEISKHTEIIDRHMSKYPVINVSFKDIKSFDGEDYLNKFRDELVVEYERHQYLLDANITERDRDRFFKILNGKGEKADYEYYLSLLAKLLHNFHNVKPIILIDEYDVPLNYSYQEGEECHQSIIDFISSMFSSALKDSKHVKASVITGCLQIAKNQIYTGLNNVYVYGVDTQEFNNYFGFTKNETNALLDYYNLLNRKVDVEKNYDGYYFSGTEIFNPWSVLRFISAGVTNSNCKCENYWSNTSGNKLLRDMLNSCFINNSDLKDIFERLIDGEELEISYDSTVVYASMLENTKAIIGTLLYTGYLTESKNSNAKQRSNVRILRIPNEEVRSNFRDLVEEINKEVVINNTDDIYKVIQANDALGLESTIRHIYSESFSIRITDIEATKQSFLGGYLASNKVWKVKLEKETGNGYCDILLVNEKQRQVAVLEIKNSKDASKLIINKLSYHL